MHQQVRTSPTRAPGAQGPDGGIVEILTILRDAGFNLQMAGGHDFDQGGEFVFAVYHEEGSDDEEGSDHPDDPNTKARDVLRENGYRARVVRAHECNVANEPGGLLGCLERIEAEDGAISEIFVGVGDQDNVPIQITTRRALEETPRDQAAS